jgi:hypothetical protein
VAMSAGCALASRGEMAFTQIVMGQKQEQLCSSSPNMLRFALRVEIHLHDSAKSWKRSLKWRCTLLELSGAKAE